jgi:hypothetical protein
MGIAPCVDQVALTGIPLIAILPHAKPVYLAINEHFRRPANPGLNWLITRIRPPR